MIVVQAESEGRGSTAKFAGRAPSLESWRSSETFAAKRKAALRSALDNLLFIEIHR